MSHDDRTSIEQKTIASFSKGVPGSLRPLTTELTERQLADWERLAEGHRSLQAAELRELQCGRYTVRLQFNPQRISSTAARVDPASIRARPCFLCAHNLPHRQQAILYRDDYLVLCNPAPVFPDHFTIAHIQHVPQRLTASSWWLLQLARDLGPELSVFYNGPRCGASAPDHLHFQACTSGVIPLEAAASLAAHRGLTRVLGGVSVCALRHLGRGCLVLESNDAEHLNCLLHRCLALLPAPDKPQRPASKDEPMINVLGRYEQGQWQIALIPRRRHRPRAYHLEGAERIVISPATVDLGGLVITPREKDFGEVDAAAVQDIFREVAFDDLTVERIVAQL